jgi:hypothetical protein
MAAPSPRKRATSTTSRTTRTSPAKRAPAKSTRTKAAAPDVELEGLDLDALEWEGEERPGPYPFHLGGEQFFIKDPIDLDWQGVLSVDPRDQIRALRVWMGEEDFLRFYKLKLPLWKINRLAKDVIAHFNLQVPDEPGAQGAPGGPGEGLALPPL